MEWVPGGMTDDHQVVVCWMDLSTKYMLFSDPDVSVSPRKRKRNRNRGLEGGSGGGEELVHLLAMNAMENVTDCSEIMHLAITTK